MVDHNNPYGGSLDDGSSFVPDSLVGEVSSPLDSSSHTIPMRESFLIQPPIVMVSPEST